jgi:hypothetical protein
LTVDDDATGVGCTGGSLSKPRDEAVDDMRIVSTDSLLLPVRLLCGAVVFSLMAHTPLHALPPQHNLGNNSLGVVSPGARYTPQRPVISPYLSLAPISGSQSQSIINYFTIIRPQFAQQAALQQQGAAIQQLAQEVHTDVARQTQQTPGVIRSTGHQAGFMTHQKYFRMQSVTQPPQGTR